LECGSGNFEFGSWNAEVGKKEAEKLRSCEGGEKIESGKLEGGLGKKAEVGIGNAEGKTAHSS